MPAGANAPVADDLLVVNCLLPGQIRQLGQKLTYVSPRQPVRVTALQCRVQGGEYVKSSRATLGSAIRTWLKAAQAGNVDAQVTLGEIYEQGLNAKPDFRSAALWYGKAASAGDARARVNLGHLYEVGLGVERNLERAMTLYRQAAGMNAAILLDAPMAPAEQDAVRVEVAGPELAVIDPLVKDLTRGFVKTVGSFGSKGQRVVGRVSAPAGLFALSINGAPIEANDAGVFEAIVQSDDTLDELLITAVDRQGKRAELRFGAMQSAVVDNDQRASSNPGRAAQPKRSSFGRYYALLIGNNKYQHMPDLVTPINDIRRINRSLQERYGFTTTLLEDATRYDILSALNKLRSTLTSEDNLLIYYAGHGELDEKNMRGHWLGVDAEIQSTANWLSNVDITDILNVIRAKQIMLVADSCYSGTLTRSSLARLDTAMTEDERLTWLKLMAEKRARVVLSSGGIAPVLDLGGGKNSVFAKAFAETLESNRAIIPGRALHHAIAARVAHAAATYEFEQLPAYAPMNRAGHEAGDFFLVAEEY